MRFDPATPLAVFLGPSLAPDEARSCLPANYYPPVRLGDVYRLLACGVHRIAIIDGVFHQSTPVWQRELLAAIDEGIEVVGGASMGALRAAELAHELVPDDSPLLQTVLHGSESSSEILRQYADELDEWVRVADAMDLTIAFKPHRGSTVSRPDEAVWIIDVLGRPNRLRICYDYSHFDLRDMTLAGTVQEALPFLAHVAVKDVIGTENGPRFVLPGEGGRIDYPQLLRLLHAGAYRGDVCCEVSAQVWSQDAYDPASAMKTCYANLSGAFENAGISRLTTKHS